MALPEGTAHDVPNWIGLDPGRPLVTQVSRFDPWKDPLGVIAAYRLARRCRAWNWRWPARWRSTTPRAGRSTARSARPPPGDPRIHLLTNLTGVGNVEVNALQRLSRVVVQKSVREGFGLIVSEALWKRTPVVAGRTGGIPLQMADGAGGFLVESVDEAAAALVRLLDDTELAEELAERGRRRVRDRFLVPRLVLDELRLVADLVSGAPPSPNRWAGRDPVCGMTVPDDQGALLAVVGGQAFVFCSDRCQARFLAEPEHFVPSLAVAGGTVP
jgi:trehalose synthase